MTVCAYAQQTPSRDVDTAIVFSPSLSSKYLDKVSSKAGQLEQKLDKQAAKSLQQWQKQEARIKRKLAKTDSLKAAAMFGNAEQQYQQLEQKLQSNASLQQYISSLDILILEELQSKCRINGLIQQQNNHFNAEIGTDDQLYIISESGILWVEKRN